MPRSIVRREMYFPVMNSIVKTSLEELRVTCLRLVLNTRLQGQLQ